MTNLLRDDDSRKSGRKANTASVESPPEPGSRANLLKTNSGTAGEPSTDVPRQFTAAEVVDLLSRAVTALEKDGKAPVAAGVSARMRTIEPGFSPQLTEYTTFRQIVRAAEEAGVITTAQGANDLILRSRPDSGNRSFQGATLRNDLWRSLLDWSESQTYAYDPKTRRTHLATPELENSIPVPVADKTQRLEWVSEFASQQRGAVGREVAAALGEEDPSVAFQSLIRGNEPLRRRWNKYLRIKVLESAARWADRHGIPQTDIFTSPEPQGPPEQASIGPASETSDEALLRARILNALSSMPLHELLRLPVPLEYTLTR